jgi:HEAT repeat protein
MTRRLRILTAILCVVALSLIVFILRKGSSKDIVINGDRLSTWLSRLDPHENSPAVQNQARSVIEVGGTSAIPFLILELRMTDKKGWLHELIGDSTRRRISAVRGFAALGPIAAPAIPALSNDVGQGDEYVARDRLVCLSHIGEKAVPAILAALDLTNTQVQATAMNILTHLASCGTNVSVAIPKMLQLLDQPERAYSAANVLMFAKDQDSQIVPPLLAYLTNGSLATRCASIYVLSAFTTNQLVIETLRNLRNEPREEIRRAAEEALKENKHRQ